ncbi:Rieske 2Fe-2S domain-containing protein [Epibacterium sp. SM1979]|uniref:Rieske 2Fe-2S domain-containing protein n=1 Tax=Tritonibacter litoralis TaxID=2662264 RepID=A0A843YEN5_9RHOB|nr:aromatic ring-hydroxylating dioxygenase subunit alpha [Tritonibacter litoralis]MQQ07762.1 Rieske 2Fe-2S domain-containing protein [Tritonibacter litoralis]
MTDHHTKVRSALDACKPGFSLPKAFYNDADLFEADIEAVFYREWLFVGPECEIPNAGDYVTLTVHEAPIIVLRDHEGEVRAFHNSCRHRGSRLCDKARGHTGRLVCPYHQWTYELTGELISTRYMGETFDAGQFPLKPVHVTSVEGLLYICLADTPPDIERFRAEITPYIRPHAPRRTKIVHESVIVEDANWKLVIENNRECYHCAGNHPELLVSLVEMALPNDARFGDEFRLMEEKARDWDALGLPHAPVDGGTEFRCIRLPFREGAKSMTLDGELASKKLLGELTEPDLGSVRAFRIPNNWHHVLSEMTIHFRVLPLGPNRSEVRTTWCVHEDAIEGWDYDVKHLSHVWIETNDQDKRLAEENQRGTRSPAYEPGPYSEVSEFMILNFLDWYKDALDAWLSGASAQQQAAE